jgi:hypothetical protein
LLDVIKRALREYLDENGEYPVADSSSLTKKLGGFLQLDRRSLDRQGRIVDVWAKPLVYQRPSPGTVRLYSLGPNGRDEDGGGDDIVLPDK